jgi:hypothetical protein
VSGGEHKTKKVVLKGDKVHPSVERAVKIIKESFQKLCLEDQDILGKIIIKETSRSSVWRIRTSLVRTSSGSFQMVFLED